VEASADDPRAAGQDDQDRGRLGHRRDHRLAAGAKARQRPVAREIGREIPLERAVRLGGDAKVRVGAEDLRQLAAGDLEAQVEDPGRLLGMVRKRLGAERRRPPLQQQALIDLAADLHRAVQLESVAGPFDEPALSVQRDLERLVQRAVAVGRHVEHVTPARAQRDDVGGVRHPEHAGLGVGVEGVRLLAHDVPRDVGVGAEPVGTDQVAPCRGARPDQGEQQGSRGDGDSDFLPDCAVSHPVHGDVPSTARIPRA